MDTDCDISKIDVLLYQTRGIEDRKGMEDEIEKICMRGKSWKRPVEYNSANASDRIV